MKIRMLTGISGPTINVSPKEETEAFSDDEAQRLIDSGQAELVDATPAPKPAAKPAAKPAPKPRAPAKPAAKPAPKPRAPAKPKLTKA